MFAYLPGNCLIDSWKQVDNKRPIDKLTFNKHVNIFEEIVYKRTKLFIIPNERTPSFEMCAATEQKLFFS